MTAKKGNQYWRARSSHGRKPKFSDPDVFWDACCEYFDWIEEHPLSESIVYQGKLSETSNPLMRAMTVTGLRLFLDISHTTWGVYKENDDLVAVITRAEEVIYTQKFSGAAAGLLNANIIARDLGLADKSQTDHSSRDGTMSPKSFNDFYKE